ncbi:AraC family transcriptional regulator [Amycolatopsis sp. DSM 110486]|uniref:AraC family transcriptional regulator n=1 Tax=Amycolatopsis sp. DSM 110486 TaxID=2865832 RepID=UPI001C69ADB9|nr:AraC family transcriptional regulator [Amycolatopsis sp. DSM 110486]QYN21354.1 AraC family transcriptional regulator [Amycolatopsis sp. DSM 110486]
MDALSRLIRLVRPESSIDVRCLMAGRFSVDQEAAAPGQVPFYVALEGRCTVTTAAAVVDLAPGDLLVLPHGDAHHVHVTSGRKLPFEDAQGATFTTRRTIGAEPDHDLFCGHFHFDTAAGMLLFRLLPSLLHVTLNASALALAEVLRAEAAFDGPGTSAIVSSVCDALLAMALRSRPEQRLGTSALWTAMGDDVLGEVIAGVVERRGEPWTIERMVAAASMSRATFVRRFTARTGGTVATLLTTVRMMVAADLLANSDRSVVRIAGEVGYRSESAFVEAFRAAVGTSPARFRKNSMTGG